MNTSSLNGSDDRERSSGGGFNGEDEGHHHVRPIDKVDGSNTKQLHMKWLQYNYILHFGRRNEVGGILNVEMDRGVLAVERMSDRIRMKVGLN